MNFMLTLVEGFAFALGFYVLFPAALLAVQMLTNALV
jgi:hypothetical protein